MFANTTLTNLFVVLAVVLKNDITVVDKNRSIQADAGGFFALQVKARKLLLPRSFLYHFNTKV